MKPKILLSLPSDGGKNYIKAFAAYGFEVSGDYLTQNTPSDALVLCGGGDIDPSYYGETPHGSFPADKERDKCEFLLFEKYFNANKPIFGICRGMQLINTAMGGNLFQHMQNADSHKGECDIIHTVSNLAGTPVFSLYGKKMNVNSAHHQCCNVLGKGLQPMQKHADGTVEGFFGKNIIGLQWHPERMTQDFKNNAVTAPDAIFRLFRDMISNTI
ncbi:MAG: gamma-glutamyl-gamma-aminobutyrate hydrolase family protein [Clostridia bacterium]|nr:gamma-glutamyl-gamma-aminobutyrate hydrolase family protein [Clostridia bacterium]